METTYIKSIHPNFKDITGQIFGRLHVTTFHSRESRGMTRWTCLCECGNTTIVNGAALKSGATRSCGCYQKEWASTNRLTHGHSKRTGETSEYGTWCKMKARCYNLKDRKFPSYGGRGIKICDRWLEYKNFYADMGRKPTLQHTIDRIDNDGNYAPENCRWATPKEQARNRRSNHIVTYNGKEMSLIEWEEHLNIRNHSLASRIYKGWDIKRAFTQPYRKPRRKTT